MGHRVTFIPGDGTGPEVAAEGVKAVVTYAKDGKKASGYTDTGVTLITDKAQDGVTSKDTVYGLENCWG